VTEEIGRFEILEKIGEGGMGTVFKARDPHINRVVALKLLREGFDTQEMRERFMQEARLAGSLQNPYIVTIFELGEHRGAPFLVMEFVVGQSLDEMIRQGAPLSLLRRLELMQALCSGLEAAHRAGVIHRDIKPQNLMVIPGGALKILDFGIARVGNSEMTKAGVLLGSPNYMSPEQLSGEPIDKRADIFAVGAVFYEILSYERAFPGNPIEAIAGVLMREPTPIRNLHPWIDVEIATVVEKALRKNRDERYHDIGEMRREIVRIQTRLEEDAPATLIQTVESPTLPGDATADGTSSSVQKLEEERRRAYSEINAARRLFDEGRRTEALQRLETFAPPNEFVARALATLHDRADEIERKTQRASAIARALKSATDSFERGDLESAIRAADEALLLDERCEPARDLRRRARNALNERGRRTEHGAEPRALGREPAPPVAHDAEPATVLRLSGGADAPGVVETQHRPRIRWIMLISGLAIVGMVAIGVQLYRSRVVDRGTSASAALPPPAATTSVPPLSSTPEAGVLVLDAVPWAEIVAIVAESGETQSLPSNPMTPITISLPPGQYEVTMRNKTRRTIRVRLERGGVTQPDALDFGRIDAAEYFKKLGW